MYMVYIIQGLLNLNFYVHQGSNVGRRDHHVKYSWLCL